jgi:hypothetical protein
MVIGDWWIEIRSIIIIDFGIYISKVGSFFVARLNFHPILPNQASSLFEKTNHYSPSVHPPNTIH